MPTEAPIAGTITRSTNLVQKTCLVALQRPPRARDNLRDWLAAVLPDLVRQRHRGALRRQQRDLARQQKLQVEPSTADLGERAATHRALVDGVLTLDDPYRSAILLRLFEGLPPRDREAPAGPRSRPRTRT